MINATLCGRIGRDAETRTAGSSKVTTWSVATSRYAGQGKGDNGTNYKTTWVDCQLWGERGDRLRDLLRKGVEVTVAGDVWLDTYQKKDGTPGSTLRCDARDVVLHKGEAAKPAAAGTRAPVDDEIPF